MAVMIKFRTGQEKVSSDPESVILIVTHRFVYI